MTPSVTKLPMQNPGYLEKARQECQSGQVTTREGVTGSLNPEGPRRGLGGTRAQTRPPRPWLLGRKSAGQEAALGRAFPPRATGGGQRVRGLGCGRGREPGLRGAQGPQHRAAERPGRARAEPDPDRPEPGRRHMPLPSRHRRQRQPRQKEARRPRHSPQTRLTWTCPRHSRR